MRLKSLLKEKKKDCLKNMVLYEKKMGIFLGGVRVRDLAPDIKTPNRMFT